MKSKLFLWEGYTVWVMKLLRRKQPKPPKEIQRKQIKVALNRSKLYYGTSLKENASYLGNNKGPKESFLLRTQPPERKSC